MNGRRTLDLVPAVTLNAYEVNGVDYDQVAFQLEGNPPPPFDTPKVDWADGEARGTISWRHTQPPNPDADVRTELEGRATMGYPEATLADLQQPGVNLLVTVLVPNAATGELVSETMRVPLDQLAEALYQRLPRDSPVAGG